jgi:hypothetical protein
MLLLAAAIVSTTPQNAPLTRVGATVQARATVRIITGVTVRLGEGALIGEAPRPRFTTAHAEGEAKPAKLIEFE